MTPELPPWVDGWCRSSLGAAPAEALFVVSHLSEVVGVRLEDGREVVLKRRPDEAGRARACVRAQLVLAEDGFPCPRPLTGAITSGRWAVHAEQLVAGGDIETGETPAAAARSAKILRDLVRRLARFELEPPLPNPEWVSWDVLPERHASSAVPEWIDETQRRVQAKLAACAVSPVLGHVDWEAQNMRWRDGDLFVVHDWDSLGWLPEAAIAGTAAGVFASHGLPTLAPLESSATFLAVYEGARGGPFSRGEQEAAWAASLWVALHNARDELIFNRPRLTLPRLEAQRVERLARAEA